MLFNNSRYHLVSKLLLLWILTGCGYKKDKDTQFETKNYNTKSIDPFQSLYNLFDIHQKVLYLSDMAFKECNTNPNMYLFYKIRNDDELLFCSLKTITEKKMNIIPIPNINPNQSTLVNKYNTSYVDIIIPLMNIMEIELNAYKEIQNHTTNQDFRKLTQEAIENISQNLASMKNCKTLEKYHKIAISEPFPGIK